ncbi:MAG: hypothetical protein NTY38_28990, partial [Acidobacteria bacterium]|nr:hypothetical protein [Acidobacteriota bacterium]
SAQVPVDPPLLIQLVTKPGVARESLRPYAAARASVQVLGMTSMTGMVETWYVELHDSFGGIEDLDRALTAAGRGENSPDEVLAPSRSIIAVYRQHLGHHSDQAVKLLPRAHYFHVSWFRIRPGTESSFAQMVKLRQMSLDSVNYDRPDIAYQVISGAAAGTYIFLAPLATLRTIDESMARVLPAYAEPLAAASARARAEATAEGEISREHTL